MSEARGGGLLLKSSKLMVAIFTGTVPEYFSPKVTKYFLKFSTNHFLSHEMRICLEDYLVVQKLSP